MTFTPSSYEVIFDDPSQAAANTIKLNQMVADINAAGYGEVQWPVGKCAIGGLDPIYANVKWVGSHERASILVTNDATNDILPFYGSTKFVDMGMDSSVVKTSGNFINLAGTNNYIPGTTEFVGGGCVIDSVYLSRAYVGIKSTGWWNKINNATIRDMTPRFAWSNSGAIWVADAGCTITKSILGNQVVPGDPVGPQNYQADWCVRHTRGEMHLYDVKGFLTFNGIVLDPGLGDTILISEVLNSAMDNVQSSAWMLRPTNEVRPDAGPNPRCMVQFVDVSGSWLAPGWAKGAAYACVVDNSIGAPVHKINISRNRMQNYNALPVAGGCGLYINAGSNAGSQALELQATGNQIGGDNFGFATGALVQGNAKRFNIDGNVISHCTVGSNIGTGCDNYINRNTYDHCGTAVSDPNTGPAAIRGPNLIY